MKLLAFTVLDIKADAYITPFFLPRKEMAVRAFADAVNSPSHQFNAHPGDYVLWHIGEFDVDTGAITPAEFRNHVVDGLSVYKPFKSADQLDAFPANAGGAE